MLNLLGPDKDQTYEDCSVTFKNVSLSSENKLSAEVIVSAHLKVTDEYGVEWSNSSTITYSIKNVPLCVKWEACGRTEEGDEIYGYTVECAIPGYFESDDQQIINWLKNNNDWAVSLTFSNKKVSKFEDYYDSDTVSGDGSQTYSDYEYLYLADGFGLVCLSGASNYLKNITNPNTPTLK